MPVATGVESPREQEKTGAGWVGNRERSGSIRLVACGVDTWKPMWYVDPEGPEARWFEEHMDPNVGYLPVKIDDHTVGYDPRNALVWAEGKPRAEGLASAGDLLPAYRRLCYELAVNGVPLPEGRTGYRISRARYDKGTGGRLWSGVRTPGEAGLGRLDVTADFETPTSLYGLELLKALQAIQFAGGCARPYGAHNMWETIVIPARNGKRILGRVYDKGLETKTAPRGRLLRAEDQRRFNAERRRPVESIDGEFLCNRWQRRFKHFAKAIEGVVTVSDPITACAVIQAKIESGELDPLKGERLVATVMLDYLSGNSRRGDRVTLWRRRRELRELGIVTDAGTLERGSTQVAVGEPFEMANHPRLWE